MGPEYFVDRSDQVHHSAATLTGWGGPPGGDRGPCLIHWLIQQPVLGLNPFEQLPLFDTTLFEDRVNQFVLAGVVHVQEFEDILKVRPDHFHAISAVTSTADKGGGCVQSSGQSLMDSNHV
jgi:hypothetical protein